MIVSLFPCGASPVSEVPSHEKTAPAAEPASSLPGTTSPSTFASLGPVLDLPFALRNDHGDRVPVADTLRPIGVAAADFDEDGVRDLVGAYRTRDGSAVIVLHRGNVDAIYPHSPEAQERRARGTFTDAPFLSPARSFGSTHVPTMLGAGDFDGDGHADVLTAVRGTSQVFVRSGDGKGGLGPSKGVSIPGEVTALATGDVDRVDGLADIVVSTATGNGPKLLIFESPAGALRAAPLTIDLPGAASAIAMGPADGDDLVDIALAVGRRLIVIHGRDETLRDALAQSSPIPQRVIDEISLPGAIRSIVLGRFDADGAAAVAVLLEDGRIWRAPAATLAASARRANAPAQEAAQEAAVIESFDGAVGVILSARSSSGPGDHLVVLEEPGRASTEAAAGGSGSTPGAAASAIHELRVATAGRPIAVVPMRLNTDALDDLVVLRDPPEAEGAEAGSSPLAFAMSATMPFYMVTTTADGGAGSLRQAILDANGHPGADLIVFNIPPAGPKTIQPVTELPHITDSVTIDGSTQPGYSGYPIIELDGTVSGGMGLQLESGSSPSVVYRLVINRFASVGIYAAGTGHTIEGNYLGTNSSGTVAMGNFQGAYIAGSNCTVGGTTASSRNLLSGNVISGVSILGSNNQVKGNFIGTNAAGDAPLPNLFGVSISTGGNNNIGGAETGSLNVISGNSSSGINITGGVGFNYIRTNLIGTDQNGSAPLPNGGPGIEINGAPSNNMTGNAVSWNGAEGIVILNAAAQTNAVFSNSIGINLSNAASGNGQNGIRVGGGAFNTYIGLGANGGNIIAHNGAPGVFLESGTGNLVLHNRIFANNGLGIDLGPLTGVTVNDVGDADVGANNLQNYPVLNVVSTCGASTTISGALNSTPLSSFQVQLFANAACDPLGYGEGEERLSSDDFTISTDGGGTASISRTLSAPVAPGRFVTATATDGAGNTSEFSACAPVQDLAPAEVQGLVWNLASKTNLRWFDAAGATGYRLYQGVRANLPNLTNAAADSCLRFSGPGSTTGERLGDIPAPGDMFWYLVRPENGCGEGSAGSGSLGPRVQNSSGSCACNRDKCSVGPPLSAACEPCVATICGVDPFCCNTQWDSACVNEVRTICHSLSCSGSAGACPHTQCAVGSSMTSGCDNPPVTPSCVGQICAVDPFCCGTFWDAICVNRVGSTCGYNCN